MTLSWTASSNATSYQVWRSSGGQWSLIDETAQATCIDNNVLPETTYQYYLIAINAAGSSSPSAIITVKTPPSIWIDLDIDSDNNNGRFGAPDRSQAEDDIENDPNHVGKIIRPNWGDINNNGILDIWDGYNYGSQFNSGAGCSEQFVPIKIEIPASIDLASATFQFDFWSGSLATGTPGREPQQFGNGNIRIWTKDGNLPRNGNDIKQYGNIVSDGMSYTAQQLGFTDTERTITLYVEGHSIGYNAITIGMDCVYNGQNVHVEDAVKYTVEESHWGVLRKADKATAVATSGLGDTIIGLATDIGLQTNEFKAWLTINTQTVMLEDNTEIPASELKVGDRLASGQEFLIPNTIYMAWFGETGSYGKDYMDWTRNAQNLSYLGFHIVPFDNDVYMQNDPTTAKWNFVRGLEILAESKSVHGLYMMGHGSSSTIGSEGWSETIQNYTVIGPLWKVLYVPPYDPNNPNLPPNTPVISSNISLGTVESLWSIADALNYHLGAVIIQACESNGSNATQLVSTNGGFFSGKPGTYIPMHDDLAFYWGGFQQGLWTMYGGPQKTNKFSLKTFG